MGELGDTTQMIAISPLLALAVAGIVELLKALAKYEYWKAIIIGGAGLVGYLLTFLPDMPGTGVEGMIAGFMASGAITALQNVGKSKSSELG